MAKGQVGRTYTNRRYRERNRDKVRAMHRAYYESHKEAIKTRAHERDAYIRSVINHDMTIETLIEQEE